MCRILAVVLLQFASLSAAPLNLQLRHPLQKTAQHPQQMLQQQLLELQHLQGFQQKTDWPAQLGISPVIILLPSQIAAKNINDHTKISADTKSSNKEVVNEDLESITVDADTGDEDAAVEPQNIVLLPNYARLSLGDIIAAIPFLPIEINVPDTIGWAYNGISSGISSIISIFGRLPFVSRPTNPTEEVRLKSTLQLLQMKKQNSFASIILMPITPQIVPIQLPIQV
ncbi:unnamed protein product, partial [Iphiclides podalirius]